VLKSELIKLLSEHRDNDVYVYVPVESGTNVELKIVQVMYRSLNDVILLITEEYLDLNNV